jgi:hypothetical protein
MGRNRPEKHTYQPVSDALRRPFFWSDEVWLRLPPDIIFWDHPLDVERTTVLHVTQGQRWTMADTAYILWKGLKNSASSADVMQDIALRFEISPEVLASLVQDFTASCLEEGIVQQP